MKSINRKSGYAIAAMAITYVIAFEISQPHADLSGAGGYVIPLVVVLPVVALVLTVLSLREIRRSRRAPAGKSARARPDGAQAYWPAVVALVLLFAFAGPFAFYGVKKHERVAPAASAVWTKFTSKAGDFVAELPATPTETEQTVPRPEGPVTLDVTMASLGDDESYSVMRVDSPRSEGETPSATLDRLEADFAKRNGAVLARADVSAGAVPGRELRVHTRDKALRVRIFASHGRVYQVLVMRPISGKENAAEDTRFLDSFRLQTR